MSKRFLNGLLGIWGNITVSIVVTVALLIIYDISGSIVGEIVFEFILLRILYSILTAPSAQITPALKNKSLFGHLKAEMRISIAFMATCYLMEWEIPKMIALQIVAINFVMQMLWNLFSAKIRTSAVRKLSASGWLKSSKQALIIGTGKQATKAADRIIESIESDTSVIGFIDNNRDGLWRYRDIPLIGSVEELEKIISQNQIDFIVLALGFGEISVTIPRMAAVEKMGVSILLVSELYQPAIAKTHSTNLGSEILTEYFVSKQDRISALSKAIIDRIGALFGIIVAAPILILTALLIKIDSRGPVLFGQIRSGHNGRPFKLWKFRTMVIDAEQKKNELQKLNEMSGPVFKIARDPRITRIGSFLRKYSIDELPQLFNVLRGEMSLVGPRPPLPSEVVQFKPWQHRKLSVKPGLTCLWQTSGRNDIDFEEWMKLDLKYIDNWSLWEDAKIIARTVPTVLKGSGK